jgi:hypothetical protein
VITASRANTDGRPAAATTTGTAALADLTFEVTRPSVHLTFEVISKEVLVNIALWIISGLLAVMFLGVGALKLSQSKEQLAAKGFGWVNDFSAGAVKGIGAAEVLGAIGLILPGALKIAPVLVPLAATGLAVTMVGAAYYHLKRKENNRVAAPVVLFLLCVLVAWGRFGPYHF